VIFQVFDLVLFFAGFQAGKAKVTAVEFHITQRTQEPSAGCARDHSFFLRVIKAGGLISYHLGLDMDTRGKLPEQGREDLYVQKGVARGAMDHAG